MMNKIFIDAREMKHPEPLQRSLLHLKNISDDEYLYMLNMKNPIPLLEMAKEKGFIYITHQDSSEIWHILISKNRDISLGELLEDV